MHTAFSRHALLVRADTVARLANRLVGIDSVAHGVEQMAYVPRQTADEWPGQLATSTTV